MPQLDFLSQLPEVCCGLPGARTLTLIHQHTLALAHHHTLGVPACILLDDPYRIDANALSLS